MMKCCIDKKGLEFCYECDEFVCDVLSKHSKKNERYLDGLNRLKECRNQKKKVKL